MQTVVGVLRGGPSKEHEISLRSGAAILANLPEERYALHDIYIDREGNWHDRGRQSVPEKILRQLDVVLNGLHGEYGEDGQVQKLLERFGIRYAGSDSFGSYLAMHKMMSKERARESGLLTPEYRYIESATGVEEVVKEIIRNFHQPVVVKPVGLGSSAGVFIVGGYAHVLSTVQSLFENGIQNILIEEYIRGQEATVGVVEGLRGETYYVLPIVEIIPPAGDFYSYEAKYSGETKLVCPGNFSRVTREELQIATRAIHRALGLRHYSRSDFIVSPRGIYYLETNSLPGLTDKSDLPLALASVGVTMPEFLSHLVNLALSR